MGRGGSKLKCGEVVGTVRGAWGEGVAGALVRDERSSWWARDVMNACRMRASDGEVGMQRYAGRSLAAN